MTHRFHAIWISLVALAFGATVFSRRRASSLPTAAAGAVAAASSALPKPGPVLPTRGWELGTEYVHALDYRFAIGPTGRELPSDQAALHLTGRWRSVVAQRDPHGARVFIQLQAASIEAADDAAKAGVATTTTALGQPFYADYDARGRALCLHLPPATDTLALGLLRELVSISQFSAAESPSGTWQAFEADQAGEYSAEYRWLGRGIYLRSKGNYVRLPGASGSTSLEALAPVIRQAATRFELDDWGRSSKLEASYEVTTPDPGNGTGFATRTQLRLQQLSRGHAETPAPLTGLVRVSLTADSADLARADGEMDRQLAGDATIASLLAELRQLAPDNRDGAFGIQSRLAALFRLQPDAIGQAMARLDARNAATILGALGAAGTPPAQRALAAVAGDERRDEAQRQLAVDAMLSVEHPVPVLREALATLRGSKYPELKNNASLMLGTMAARDADTNAKSAIVEQLSREARGADSRDARVNALHSLGNTRAEESLPAIAEGMASDDPAIRSAAASALRFVPQSGADELLSKALISDPDPSVRRSALMAASYRAYNPLAAALEAVSKRDPDPSVRAQAVTTLTSIARQDDQSLLLLGWLAEHDRDAQVRQQAQRALASATL